jgi:cytochrome b subunit of formate dehydrogenase
MTEKSASYQRFPISQRIEHILLLLSFTILGITGLVQKFIGAGISLWLIDVLGGIGTVRIIHRVAATIFLLELIYHFVLMGYKLYVQRVEMTMLPGVKDIKDGIQSIGYNVGLAKSRPKLARFTFDEKVEYWAMMWGNLVMIITGFMLWNPIKTTNILPGVFIPAAKAAHGGEAVLAILAILVWHLYHVHIKYFNKSIFTGKLTRHEMEEEHPLELEKLEAGAGTVLPSSAVVKKRKTLYFPIAAAISLIALAGVYYFVTAETTSITTLPPAEQAQILSTAEPTKIPEPPTPAPTTRPMFPGAVSNDLSIWDGGLGELLQTKCGMCHGTSGGLSLGSYADALKGGTNGAVIIPGDANTSIIVKILEAGGHPSQLTVDELAALKTWILAGAPEK